MLCKKNISAGFGVLALGALSAYLVKNKFLNKKKNQTKKKVLCIEIGGTSSRIAIFEVNKKTKEIALDKTKGVTQQLIENPSKLVKLIESNNNNQ